MKERLKRIHINMHKIRANKKNGTKEPVITIKTSKKNIYAHTVKILGGSDIIYSGSSTGNITYAKNLGESIHIVCYASAKWSVVAHV